MPLAMLSMIRLDMAQKTGRRCDGANRPAPPRSQVMSDSPAVSASDRPLHLAPGFLDRGRDLVAGHQALHGEHVVGVVPFGRVGLAGQDRAHELVIAGA